MAEWDIRACQKTSEFAEENIYGFERHGGFCVEVAMDYYLILEHWGELVRDFKDSEKEHGMDAYETERLAREILDYIRYTRIRQWTLFVQKRGEEFEKMMEMLYEREYDIKAARRFLENEELWKVTLELGEQ